MHIAGFSASPIHAHLSSQTGHTAAGAESGERILPKSSTRANAGLSASLEAELQDLERHWEDLDCATAQDAAEAQPATHGTVHSSILPLGPNLAQSWRNKPCPFRLAPTSLHTLREMEAGSQGSTRTGGAR